MFGRRKSVNRRRRRRSLLDVKLSTDKRRREKIRLASKIVLLLAGLLVLFFGVWRGGELLVDVAFYKNNAFAIQKVVVKTDGKIKAKQLSEWAGVKRGDNLFEVDLIEVKRKLEQVPFIKSAAVDRVLPSTLRLRVAEREPVAQVMIYRRALQGDYRKTLYHLDSEGHVIEPLPNMDRQEQMRRRWLPMITGISESELLPGRVLDHPRLHVALELIDRFNRSPMAGLAHLQQIDVAAPRTLKTRTWQGSEVFLALNGLDRQLFRWRLIYDYGRQHRRVLAKVDLSIKNHLPVRWREAQQANNEQGIPSL